MSKHTVTTPTPTGIATIISCDENELSIIDNIFRILPFIAAVYVTVTIQYSNVSIAIEKAFRMEEDLRIRYQGVDSIDDKLKKHRYSKPARLLTEGHTRAE